MRLPTRPRAATLVWAEPRGARTVWLKDIARDFKAMNGVWNAWVDQENKPVRATVQSPLATPLMLVEIQVTAAVA